MSFARFLKIGWLYLDEMRSRFTEMRREHLTSSIVLQVRQLSLYEALVLVITLLECQNRQFSRFMSLLRVFNDGDSDQ